VSQKDEEDQNNPHSPEFCGRQSASKGEDRLRLDFPLIHDAGPSYQPQNNANNIKGLAFYHEIRWSLIFSDAGCGEAV
jgi:hypothetical protein